MSTDYAQVEEMSREELEDEVKGLRQRLDDLENTVDFLQEQFFELDDLLMGNTGTAKAHMIVEEDGDVFEQVQKAQRSSDNKNVSNALSGEIRDRLLPVHKMWIDVRDGDGDNLKVNQRRAAILFGRLIKKAAGQPNIGVNADYGTYSMSSKQVIEVLEEEGEMSSSGKSTIARRAMQAVQSLTKVEECDCSNIDFCDHGLVQFDTSEKTNYIAAEKDKFNAVMENVQSAIDVAIGGEQEDNKSVSSKRDELGQEADQEFDDLMNAETR